ncbi:MAG: IclR family transcriptional regulator [Halobellus sp.]|uniref:IclR family transcriptional regulator n=1 Tax=Halobellus sp. TaxID=1979212 RepID=UPI0035D45F6B
MKDGDAYRLSLKFLNVGGILRHDEPLYEAAKPNVDELAAETGELATLATHERGLAVVLHRAKGENAVDIDTHVGSQVTLHNSALGKATLAHLPDERIEGILDHRGLPAITENTITDRAELFDELDRTAARGHAFDDEENWRGLRCIGAPILTEAGAVVGAISLSVPKNRIDSDEDREAYVSQIKNVANLIELRLTYS